VFYCTVPIRYSVVKYIRLSHPINNHCITLQHTATHCNTLQRTATHCNALQHTATHCNTMQRAATHCNALQRTATHCNALQRTATHCNTLQHIRLSDTLQTLVSTSGTHAPLAHTPIPTPYTPVSHCVCERAPERELSKSVLQCVALC